LVSTGKKRNQKIGDVYVYPMYKNALPTPKLSNKEHGQFDEVFAQDMKPWNCKINNDPFKF